MSDFGAPVSPQGELRTDTLSRVFESRISTPLTEVTAMNRPHGDQTGWQCLVVTPTLAVRESHVAGAPVTILVPREQICWPYSFRTIDDMGASGSAEW